MKAQLRPGTRKDLAVCLGQLAIVYASSHRTEHEWEMLFDIYSEDLAEVPADILADACRAYRRDPANKFFPTPGQILGLCNADLQRRRLFLAGLNRVRDDIVHDVVPSEPRSALALA